MIVENEEVWGVMHLFSQMEGNPGLQEYLANEKTPTLLRNPLKPEA